MAQLYCRRNFKQLQIVGKTEGEWGCTVPPLKPSNTPLATVLLPKRIGFENGQGCDTENILQNYCKKNILQKIL